MKEDETQKIINNIIYNDCRPIPPVNAPEGWKAGVCQTLDLFQKQIKYFIKSTLCNKKLNV